MMLGNLQPLNKKERFQLIKNEEIIQEIQHKKWDHPIKTTEYGRISHPHYITYNLYALFLYFHFYILLKSSWLTRMHRDQVRVYSVASGSLPTNEGSQEVFARVSI